LACRPFRTTSSQVHPIRGPKKKTVSATKAQATGPGPAATKGPTKKIGTRKIGAKANPTGPTQGVVPPARRPHHRRAANAVNEATTMGLLTARAIRAGETADHFLADPTNGNRAVLADRLNGRGWAPGGREAE